MFEMRKVKARTHGIQKYCKLNPIHGNRYPSTVITPLCCNVLVVGNRMLLLLLLHELVPMRRSYAVSFRFASFYSLFLLFSTSFSFSLAQVYSTIHTVIIVSCSVCITLFQKCCILYIFINTVNYNSKPNIHIVKTHWKNEILNTSQTKT